jgi:cytosine/adenosine deaminase-related metal-dependent hydrolase
LTKKVLVANANYDEDDLSNLAQTGAKFIYQPLYSEEICNKKLDFKTVLENFRGNFGLSTQSFAQNRSFSLLKLASELNKDVNLEVPELIKYLTIYPAQILRLDSSIGTIEKGKDADFNVFKLDNGEDFNDLLKHEIPYSVYSRGRKLIKRGDVRFSL